MTSNPTAATALFKVKWGNFPRNKNCRVHLNCGSYSTGNLGLDECFPAPNQGSERGWSIPRPECAFARSQVGAGCDLCGDLGDYNGSDVGNCSGHSVRDRHIACDITGEVEIASPARRGGWDFSHKKVSSLIYCGIFFITLSNSGPKSGFRARFYSRNELNWWNLFFHVLCILDVFGDCHFWRPHLGALARCFVVFCCLFCPFVTPRLWISEIDDYRASSAFNRRCCESDFDVEVDDFDEVCGLNWSGGGADFDRQIDEDHPFRQSENLRMKIVQKWGFLR